MVDFLGEGIGGGIGVSVGGSFTLPRDSAAVLDGPALLLGAGDVADATDAVDFAVMD